MLRAPVHFDLGIVLAQPAQEPLIFPSRHFFQPFPSLHAPLSQHTREPCRSVQHEEKRRKYDTTLIGAAPQQQQSHVCFA
jgi:hypothetical protein